MTFEAPENCRVWMEGQLHLPQELFVEV